METIQTEANAARPSQEVEIYGKKEQRLDDIDAVYGGEGFEYHGDLLVGEIKGILRHVEYEFLEIGRRLILIKEHEGHGNFLKRLEEIGMPDKTARNFMRATVGAQSMGYLANASNRPTVGQFENGRKLPSISKILEITFLGDDELKELGEGGTVAGLHLDDIDRMSVREVRAALREEKDRRREEVKLREEVIRKKEEKISEMERQLRGLPPKTVQEVNREHLKELYNEMLRRCFEIRSSIRGLSHVIREARSLPGLDVISLNEWVGKVVDDATTDVIDDWEETISELDNITPLHSEDEDFDVRTLD